MQRALHSILTVRILLDLREASSPDRAKNTLTRGDTNSAVSIPEASARTALSSVILGVETWFPDRETSTQTATIDSV
jgi:hypothetical protein